MAAPPRLFLLWHSDVRGPASIVNDAERLACERDTRPAPVAAGGAAIASPDALTGALNWKAHGALFGGGGGKRAPNRRAFDDFADACAVAVDGGGAAAGDVYAALSREADARSARCAIEAALGAVPPKKWTTVADAHAALAVHESERKSAPAARPEYRPRVPYGAPGAAADAARPPPPPPPRASPAGEGVGAAWNPTTSFGVSQNSSKIPTAVKSNSFPTILGPFVFAPRILDDERESPQKFVPEHSS